MANLQWLALNDNLLEGLPKEIGNCSKLERLHLMSNRLVVGGAYAVHDPRANIASARAFFYMSRAALFFFPLCSFLVFKVGDLDGGEPLKTSHCLFRLPRLFSYRLPPSFSSLFFFSQELPETLGKLTRIRELWLGQNTQISALPESFYQLTNLRNLNMELCSSMVFPPLQYIEQGAPAVLKYSEGRVSHSRHLRRQRMVDRLGNLFEQLHEQQPYFGRNAKPFFEAKHWHNDEEW